MDSVLKGRWKTFSALIEGHGCVPKIKLLEN